MVELTEQEIHRCKEAFAQFDKDNSGSIDVWELSLALEGERRLITLYSRSCDTNAWIRCQLR